MPRSFYSYRVLACTSFWMRIRRRRSLRGVWTLAFGSSRSTLIRRGGLKDLVLRSEGPGQLRGWQWGVFHLRDHKDVPLVTLQFRHRGIRCQSCARSVIEYIGDPAGWQPELAIGATNLVTSARTTWARELLKNPEFTCLFQDSRRRIESSDRYYPYTWFEALVLFDLGATHSFISIVFVRLSRLVVRTLEPGLAVTTPVGKIMVCKRAVCECLVIIYGRVLPTNLVVLPMFSYDVILRMDWLMRHSAVIDCA